MVTQAEVTSYQVKNRLSIQNMLNGKGVRPVLFLGSGITKRYLGGPSWLELLQIVAQKAGIELDQFNFIAQKAGGDCAEIGTLLVDPIHEWAWEKGKNKFPASYFSADVDKSIFLKHLAAEHLKALSPLDSDSPLSREIEFLKKAAPHAIITTNFDGLISELFPSFELVVGERIIPMSTTIMGELYQIHGSVDDPATLVLTRATTGSSKSESILPAR